jgi:hypothetical protein
VHHQKVQQQRARTVPKDRTLHTIDDTCTDKIHTHIYIHIYT